MAAKRVLFGFEARVAAPIVAVEALRKQSKPVRSRLEKAQVATISAHNDPAAEEGRRRASAGARIGRPRSQR